MQHLPRLYSARDTALRCGPDRVTHGAMRSVRMGVLRGVAEERVEVLDGVKKPPYQAVEISLTGATTQTLTDAHTFGQWDYIM